MKEFFCLMCEHTWKGLHHEGDECPECGSDTVECIDDVNDGHYEGDMVSHKEQGDV